MDDSTPVSRSPPGANRGTPWWRHSYVHFWMFVLLFAVVTLGIGRLTSWSEGALLGFDVAAIVFFAVTGRLVLSATIEEVRAAGTRNNGGRVSILLIAAIVVLVVFTAVSVELSDESNLVKAAVSIGTLVAAWVFGNVVCALHYAHEYYANSDADRIEGGLRFSDDDEPDYYDFLYFAFTIGMTFQVSDVIVTSRRMRRTVLLQAIVAFFYNIGVLAIALNVASTLLSKGTT